MRQNTIKSKRRNNYLFMAMNSPCEVQFDCDDLNLAKELGAVAEAEAARIEEKYSRYKTDSMLSKVNRSNGKPVAVDTEMMALLSYADSCYTLSDGLFDITSGVLRRIWRFDGSDNIPTKEDVMALLPFIGWDKITRGAQSITLKSGMEIDFGGLGKEYAVDRAMMLLAARTDVPILVNFGGDLRVSGPRSDGSPWRVAVESVEEEGHSEVNVAIRGGALTTSGDARRFLFKDGLRYSHILNPFTGWPVKEAPRSITISAPTCMEAGVMSTLAMAKGPDAEQFIKDEALAAWILR